MRREKVVKDKRIMPTGESFLAVVEYYQDKPERDGDEPLEKTFASIPGAQKWLSKFPRDAWTGHEITVIIARELDRSRQNVSRETTQRDRRLAQASFPIDCFGYDGRTLVRSMRRSR